MQVTLFYRIYSFLYIIKLVPYLWCAVIMARGIFYAQRG